MPFDLHAPSAAVHAFTSEYSSTLKFYINGSPVVLDGNTIDPEATLLDFIRTQRGLTGTKLGCGEGGCGACTVSNTSEIVLGLQYPYWIFRVGCISGQTERQGPSSGCECMSRTASLRYAYLPLSAEQPLMSCFTCITDTFTPSMKLMVNTSSLSKVSVIPTIHTLCKSAWLVCTPLNAGFVHQVSATFQPTITYPSVSPLLPKR